MAATRTFGEVVTGLVDELDRASQDIIRRAGIAADADGKRHLKVVSCHSCTAPKACCTLITTAFIHEAAVIAAHLRADGRDTPELRARLRRSAEAMENTATTPYQAPCVFLDGAERCTIYLHRPIECGVCFVYSPAEACSDPAVSEVERWNAGASAADAIQLAERFREQLGLAELPGRLHVGVMPRMVLLCLQTWDRPDYAKQLARHAWPAVG